MLSCRTSTTLLTLLLGALVGCGAGHPPPPTAGPTEADIPLPPLPRQGARVSSEPPPPSATPSAVAAPPAASAAAAPVGFEPVWASVDAGAALPPHPDGWRIQDCKAIEGPSSLALTFDSGRSLLESAAPRTPNAIAYDIVAVDGAPGRPGLLLAVVSDGLWSSEDGGCRWRRAGVTTVTRLVAAPGGVAYGWDRVGNELSLLSPLGVSKLPSPPQHVIALAVDAASPANVRVAAPDGLYDSTDHGATWARSVTRPGGERAVFAPGDPRHLLMVAEGAAGPTVTRDGGRTWAASTGFRARKKPEDAGRWWLGATSDPNVFWAMDATGVYRSTDGGGSFTWIAAPLGRKEERGHRIGVASSPDPLVLVVHSYKAVFRLDARTKKWKRHPLPAHGRGRGDGERPAKGEETWLTAAAFVPGPTPVMALGVSTVVRNADVAE